MPRTYQSKFERGEFVAWDGEGVTLRGRHRYIMLANSLGDEIEDRHGLRTADALECLLAGLAGAPRAIHVGFAFSYDVNMIVRELPRPALRALWLTGTCYWNRYRLRYRPRKEFAVQREVWRPGGGRAWVGGVVWDVFGFFQSSFLDALESYDIGKAKQREHIARMKASRSAFRLSELSNIRYYNRQELRLLVQLMERVKQYAADANVSLRRWDGAGATASALLGREGVLAHLGPDPAAESDRWPEPVRDAGQFAYFGGRIELLRLGHTQGPIYQYDIRSAYPHAMSSLPSFAPDAGRWLHNPPEPWRYRFAVHRVSWAFAPAPLYPFPWRASDGAVYFPSQGDGWYWTPEVAAARAAWATGQLAGRVRIRETWAWEEAPGAPRPFAFVPELFTLRAQWKREGRGAEKILKLGLNSLYGKMAQQIGGGQGMAPRYHLLEAAGWITSTTRARLYTAAIAAGSSAVMLATDALYTTRPQALGGEGLGSWEPAEHRSGTFVQSGVYWVGAGDDELHHFRGFDPDSLDRVAVRRAWAKGARTMRGRSRRFITLGAVVHSDAGATWARWCQWDERPRKLALLPEPGNKREYVPGRRRPRLDRALVWTRPADPFRVESYDGSGMSCPVAVPWRPLPGVSSRDLHALARAESETEDAEM